MAFTAYPSAGGPLRASVLQALIAETRPISSRLTADSAPVNNSSTFVDSGLSCAVGASKVYDMYLHILYNGSSTASDLKIGFTYPAGATALISPLGVNTADAGYNVGQAAAESTTFQFGTAAASDRSLLLLGQWVTAATAGNIVVQFAQVTPTVANNLLRAGSRLILIQQE